MYFFTFFMKNITNILIFFTQTVLWILHAVPRMIHMCNTKKLAHITRKPPDRGGNL